ncbi:MAG: hypothetical protein RMJ18_02790 [Candidatus Aenigmarchaeota archaeon]|nr:hypothetical protein [Candidatus Aenigmarchaeota archaeon]MDW8160318.1 hypothetical protein [Candidatus Aenigmarchaeota archaeon]
MKWKILFFLFLVSIVGFFVAYKKPTLEVPSLSFITGFFAQPDKTNFKQISLTLQSFDSPIFVQALNETIKLVGICTTPLNLDKVNLQLTNSLCELEFYNPRGELTVKGNLISFTLNSPNFKINNLLYSGGEKVSGSLIVRNGLIPSMISKVEMKNFKGNLQILTTNNTPSVIVNFPPCEYLELTNFVGSVSIDGTEIKVSGSSSGKYGCQNVENKI